jgi:hypothetical protein
VFTRAFPRALSFALVLSTTSCLATMESGGFQVNERATLRAFDQLRPRAQFDLRCSASSVRFVVLAAEGWTANQVGAEGCGRSAAYVKLLRPYGAEEWILNGVAQ